MAPRIRMINKFCSFLLMFFISVSCIADTVLIAPDEFSPAYQGEWQTIESVILSSKDNIIYLKWHGRGGLVSMMQDFIDVLTQAQKQGKVIVFVLTGDSYSAHAITACYATKIQNNDIYFLMFHPIADINGRPQVDPYTFVEGEDIEAPCVHKGILTFEDMRKSLTNTEVYVYFKDGKYVRYYKLDRRLENVNKK